MSPFEAALGERFHLLPPQVRQLHGARILRWEGQVSVMVASNPLARLATRLAGFPSAMDKAPFTLTLTRHEDGSETWQRDFNGFETVSTLRGGADGALQETFKGITVTLAPSVKVDQLHCAVTGARLPFGLTPPAGLTPRSDVKIWQDEAGRYRFDIRGMFPALGEAIRYQGWLLPGEAVQLSR